MKKVALFACTVILASCAWAQKQMAPSNEELFSQSSPPAVLGDADHTVKVVEAQLGGSPIYLAGYGTYTPPSTQPAYDPDCHISDDHGNPVGFFPQCLRTDNPNSTYLVLLTAAPDQPQGKAWQHELSCIYGQGVIGGGLADDDVIQTSGGNDNEDFTGGCFAAGLGVSLGSISARVKDVPFKTPKQAEIVKLGLEVGIWRINTPTWACAVTIRGKDGGLKQQLLYFGCSSSGIFNATIIANPIGLFF